MTTDRHKRTPRSIRLPPELDKRLEAMAVKENTSVNALITQAVWALVHGSTAIVRPARKPVTPQRAMRQIAESEPPTMGYSKERQARGKRP